ncbi:MAG TPA: Eco57I restriction-modification methylase domain-containing protein, partial [Allocoleopsis sp.]
IINNLYGVDIMQEATEICKLRLYLKLAGKIEPDYNKPNIGSEPLPDIDFNIRSGNSLVGFANYEQVKKAGFDQKLSDNLDELKQKLNLYLAREYGIDVKKKHDLEKWINSHQPFHWFIEFYHIINKGGFDVIIGNPPYVEYSKVKKDYEIKDYETEKCGNLYGFIVERNNKFLQDLGRTGMIIPHSSICTDRMQELQFKLINQSNLWVSTYCIRPSKLFDGVDQRLVIYILQNKTSKNFIYSSKYHRWYQELRPILFNLLEYTDISQIKFTNSLPKLYCLLENSIWHKLNQFKTLNKFLDKQKAIYFHNAPRYWIRSMNFAPYFWNEKGGEKISSHLKSIYLKTELDSLTVVAILNSSLFYWWFIILSDCRHLNMREIENFPIGLDKMSEIVKNRLVEIAQNLMRDLQNNSFRKKCNYKTTGQVIYDEFYPKLSKPIIDEIDKILAQHYGFTEEELDFIINYDIKYRMGKDSEEDE